MIWGLLAKGIGAWWTGRQEVKRAEMVNAAKRAEAGLSDKYKWLQWITFAMLTAPFVLAYVSPDESIKFWESLKTIPPWIVDLYVTIVATIWGYSVTQKGIMQIMGGVQKWHRDIKRGR